MNHAQEMFSALIKPFTGRSNNAGRRETINPPERGLTQDSEQDGFLVVGQSRSERTTVRTCDFIGNVNSPPDYQSVTQNQNIADVSDNLPSYTQYCRSLSTSSSMSMETSQYTNYQNTASTDYMEDQYDTHGHKTAVSDVPFVLNPQIQTVVDIIHGRTPSLDHHQINLSQYTYDFSLENSTVNEAERF
ncbi:uncharacterized protein LOC117343726 isoform X1 [Pecten maximus]|uniref:uncharacterized protein LOC117343726 isoform X1 n=1 Tax=Pecten maximus TaxID=6579 RepID=UPI001458D751|nr:uncharacterized protein LOC117343726 isoform X1 [Pecten maximus]XP_033762088.1 uncharacterized protein LOC117343726 isoform X1 [Pecten maximus]